MTFATVEALDSLAVRRGRLSGIDELRAHEDVLILQREHIDHDCPERLHTALQVTAPMPLTLH